MRKTEKDLLSLRQVALACLLLAVGALAAKMLPKSSKETEHGENPNREVQEKLIAAYIAEHEMLWGEITTRLESHKTVLNISVTALAVLITIGVSQTGWRDALLAGPILGFLSTAMLLRQWQGWTMVTYYFQQSLHPGYLTALEQLGEQIDLELEVPPFNWINYVNARSAQQPFGYRQMLKFLWLSDYLLPMFLGIACLVIFTLLEPSKLYIRPYQLVLFVDSLVTIATMLLYVAFRRWRRQGFSPPG
jgi:hypothetical protein